MLSEVGLCWILLQIKNMVDLYLKGQGHVHTSFCIFWKSLGQSRDDCELVAHLVLGVIHRRVHTLLKDVLKWGLLRGPGSMQGVPRVF